MKSKLNLLNLTKGGELVKFPRKPPAVNHPFRKKIYPFKRENNTEERNLRWLNQWSKKTNKSFPILWTSDLYAIEQKQDYFPKIDESLFQDFSDFELVKYSR